MSALTRALTAARLGPELKGVKIQGHEWNIKRYKIHRLAPDVVAISGQLSHCLSLRPDDQIYYTASISPGSPQPVMVSVQINRGGFRKILAPVAGFVTGILTGSALLGVGAGAGVDVLGAQLGKLIDGTKWEQSAQFIVGMIIVDAGRNLPASAKNASSPPPRKSAPRAVSRVGGPAQLAR